MWRVPPWTCWRRGTAACAWCGTACTTDRSRPRDEHRRSTPHPAPLHLPLPPPRTGADPPAGAAFALAGCRLPGLALRPASAELLHAGQLHRSGRAQTHAGQLPRPLRRGEHRHHRAHRLDGGRGDGGGGGSGVPDLLLHGALRNPAGAGAAVPRGIAAAVVQLPGTRLLLEADPGPRGGPQLDSGADAAGRRVELAAQPPGDRRTVAVRVAAGDVCRLPLCLAALHDPAARGRAGTRARVAPGGLRGPGGPAARDVPPRRPAAGLSGRGGRLALHVLAHAGGFRRALRAGQLGAVHRTGGAGVPGHRGERPPGRRLHRGADGDHGRLSDYRAKDGRVRGAVDGGPGAHGARVLRSEGGHGRRAPLPAPAAHGHHPLRLHHGGRRLPLPAAAVHRSRFFGRETVSFLVILPIALPGIITGIALRSAISLLGIPFSVWTIEIGHATFCVVVVYNNVLARFRRTAYSQVEASVDLGASPFQTFRYIVLPSIATALLAGGMLAFALSFDEIIVTTFTAGQQETLPIWIFNQLTKPRQRPVTNIAALFVIAGTFIPILLAHRLTQGTVEAGRAGR